MPDINIIRVADIRQSVWIGVTPEERAAAQEIVLSVNLTLAAAADDDRISSTVNYDIILGFIRNGLTEPAQLIETIAGRVAAYCLTLSPHALSVEVAIEKPSVLKGEGHVGVTLIRKK